MLLLAATNADLEARIATGQFRVDLLYRLNMVEVQLPLLAARSDFREVATALLAEIEPKAQLADDALACLEGRPWPGNIRELRNVLVRLALACEGGLIDRRALAPLVPPSAGAATGGVARSALREEVRARIARAFQAEAGNVSRTARRLQVSRNTIYRAIRAD